MRKEIEDVIQDIQKVSGKSMEHVTRIAYLLNDMCQGARDLGKAYAENGKSIPSSAAFLTATMDASGIQDKAKIADIASLMYDYFLEGYQEGNKNCI